VRTSARRPDLRHPIILMKLGVRDRVRAVILLYESGVIEPGAH
jgi:hypothetical protein